MYIHTWRGRERERERQRQREREREGQRDGEIGRQPSETPDAGNSGSKESLNLQWLLGPKDHINIEVLQTIVSGIAIVLGLKTRM